jgi:hypothetical protein
LRVGRLAILLGLVLIGAASRADASIERPRVVATRARGAIRIDGSLDEPDWSAAVPITNFRVILQREGEAPSESTEVRVLVGDDRLYFGIRCGDHLPGPIRASLAPRDQILDGDHIAIHLDPYLDRRRAYIFGINPFGVQLDGLLDGTNDPDLSWDAVWDGAARRDAQGWSAELAIPFKSMRFPRGGAGVWGLWIRREITKNDEVCSWPLWRRAEQGDIMLQAGDLAGLQGLRGGGGLEGEPYVSSIASQERQYESLVPGAPLQRFDINHDDYSTGLDLRYAITSTLIANATVNPDYSQVEADAIQIDVNQRYPLFYPEKRPFFLEGADLFSSPLDLIYTRRIANPDYGGKLTGRAGRLGVGVISVHDGGGGSLQGVSFGGDREDRAGEYHIGRVTYDVGDDSRAGLLLGIHRMTNEVEGDVPADVPPAPLAQGGLDLVLAGDAKVRLARNVFWTGQLAWSRARIDSSADRAGRSIVARSVDTDVAYTGTLRYADGTRSLSVYQSYFGPRFRDESGFVQRVDVRRTGFDSNVTFRPENRWLRSAEPILNAYVIHDHGGRVQEWWVSPMVDWLLRKQTHVHTMFVRSMERWLDRDYDLDTYILVLDNTLWRSLAVSVEMDLGDGIYYGSTPETSFRGWSQQLIAGVTVRPTPRLTSEVSAVRHRFTRGAGGEELYDVWALGAKTTFQFTRSLYARVYPQYDTSVHHFDADALLGYVVHPGTVVYLGINRDYDRMFGESRLTHRNLFFKASMRIGT